MGILDDWYERAAAAPRRIVLADDDPRAHEAAARLRNDGLAEPVVIGRDRGTADLFHDLLQLFLEHRDGVVASVFSEGADAVHEGASHEAEFRAAC